MPGCPCELGGRCLPRSATRPQHVEVAKLFGTQAVDMVRVDQVEICMPRQHAPINATGQVSSAGQQGGCRPRCRRSAPCLVPWDFVLVPTSAHQPTVRGVVELDGGRIGQVEQRVMLEFQGRRSKSCSDAERRNSWRRRSRPAHSSAGYSTANALGMHTPPATAPRWSPAC